MLSPRSSSGGGRGLATEGPGRGLTADGVGRGLGTTGAGLGDAADWAGRGDATAMDGARDAGAGEAAGEDPTAFKFDDVPARESLIFFFSGCFSFLSGSEGAAEGRNGPEPGTAETGTGTGTGGTAANEDAVSVASSLGKASSRFLFEAV